MEEKPIDTAIIPDIDPPKPGAAIEMVIRFDYKQTTVSGPLDNELLCHAILESAGRVIHDFNVDRKKADAAAPTPPKIPLNFA